MATDFEIKVLAELGELKGAVAGLDKRLFNGSGVVPQLQAQIDKLESDADKEVWYDRISGSVTGAFVIAGLHVVANKLGWKV